MLGKLAKGSIRTGVKAHRLEAVVNCIRKLGTNAPDSKSNTSDLNILKRGLKTLSQKDFLVLRTRFFLMFGAPPWQRSFIHRLCFNRFPLQRLARAISPRWKGYQWQYFPVLFDPLEEIVNCEIPQVSSDTSQESKEKWERLFRVLNDSCFGGELPTPTEFSYSQIYNASQTSMIFAESGIQWRIELNEGLMRDREAFFGSMLHEMIHLWDWTSWKPIEPCEAPANSQLGADHGVYFTAKWDQLDKALGWKIPQHDGPYTPMRPLSSIEKQPHAPQKGNDADAERRREMARQLMEAELRARPPPADGSRRGRRVVDPTVE